MIGSCAWICHDLPPLTPDEWKLLHQTMDRVDAARANVPLAPPNLERIKHAALETYRSQGIEVAEKELEHALAAAQQVRTPALPSKVSWHRRCLGWARHWGLITSGPWVEKPSVPPGGFASMAWSHSKNFLGRLAGHSPRDDRTLFEAIDRSLGFQRARLKGFNQWIVGSAATIGALGIATLAVASSSSGFSTGGGVGGGDSASGGDGGGSSGCGGGGCGGGGCGG